MSDGTSSPHVPVRLLFEATKEAPGPTSNLGLTVVSVEANFGISELYEIRLVVQTEDVQLRLSSLLQRPVEVCFDGEAFVTSVSGIVRRIRAISIEPAGVSRFEVFVVPDIWLLSRRRNHRIFANLNVAEIGVTFFNEHRSTLSFVPDSTKELQKREWTVQYGETDLHAMFRLLADEGRACYFDFANGDFVVTDETSRRNIKLDAPLRYVPPAEGMMATGPHVYDVRPAEGRHVGKACVRDYDYHRPRSPIDGSQNLGVDVDLEHYEYEVGEVWNEAAAAIRASDTLLSLAAPTFEVVCVTNCLLAPGTVFRIDGHPRAETDQELLVLSVTSRWAGAGSGASEVRHELTCMPSKNPFKPVRLEKPRVPSVQTATVIGAQGKEIDLDAEGRALLRFHWDREGQPVEVTRRVRVSQSWAGAGYGLWVAPRIGDEIVVAFLDGDPDQPLVVARVHNPLRPVPVSLPDQSTVSRWRSQSSPGGDGYNEILYDDAAGKERFEVHAQRDFKQVVEHDATVLIKHDERRTVHGDHTTRTVGKGDMQYADGFNFSTGKEGTIAAKDLKINADERVDTTKGFYVNNAGTSTNHADGTYVIDATNISLQCGGSFISIAPGVITISADAVVIKSSGVVDVVGSPINLNC